jgi:hypothetical protein
MYSPPYPLSSLYVDCALCSARFVLVITVYASQAKWENKISNDAVVFFSSVCVKKKGKVREFIRWWQQKCPTLHTSIPFFMLHPGKKK